MIPKGYRQINDTEIEQLFVARQQALEEGLDPLVVLGDEPPPIMGDGFGSTNNLGGKGAPGPQTGQGSPAQAQGPLSQPGPKTAVLEVDQDENSE
jgi:hypothetical protein